jgi:predicted AlkP superfamily phosphohydrolase/phosphomutase
MGPKRKVLVIGLDCAAPALVFDSWLNDLPNTKRLAEEGIWGRMFSTIPPITCPAWMSMVTSKNPGKLGIFGFRNRSHYSYEEVWIANSTVIKEPTLWDIISREGHSVGLIGVPQTYPPRPVNGFMVTDFLAPDTSADYTYPSFIKDEIKAAVGNYILDCDEFRTEDKDALLAEIYEMTKKRFDLVEAFLAKKPDFYMFVEMGVDRIYHGFWKYMDKTHRKYVAGNKYEKAIKEYHQYIDRRIGELLKLVDEDTVVMIVSDHGAKKMEGAININDWLIQEGYLKLNEQPGPGKTVKLEKAGVDWENTKAWGLGGYYGRLFINVKGREAKGVVDPKDYEKVRNELVAKLEAITDEKGKNIGTRVIKPQEAYPGGHLDQAPDLIIYFGDLYWRSTGNIGHDSIHSFETEVGPDDAVHDEYGIFIMWDPKTKRGKELKNIKIYDVAPTILSTMGIEVPGDMEGKVLTL